MFVLCLRWDNCENLFYWVKYIVVEKHECKGKEKFSLVKTRLPGLNFNVKNLTLIIWTSSYVERYSSGDLGSLKVVINYIIN
jgi:hypothetical protein